MPLDATLSVAVDTAVRFTFTVTNTGDEDRELTFPDGLLADVAVLDDDREVWRWSDARVFTQALVTETLAPGESLAYERVWTDPDPGSYTAVATLDAMDDPVEVSAAFAVPDPG